MATKTWKREEVMQNVQGALVLFREYLERENFEIDDEIYNTTSAKTLHEVDGALEYDEQQASLPGRRSPEDVLGDRNFEKVTESDGGTWPQSVYLVVRHKPTGTLWACRYAIRNDDSDYDIGQYWEEVEAKQTTITVYEKKPQQRGDR